MYRLRHSFRYDMGTCRAPGEPLGPFSQPTAAGTSPLPSHQPVHSSTSYGPVFPFGAAEQGSECLYEPLIWHDILSVLSVSSADSSLLHCLKNQKYSTATGKRSTTGLAMHGNSSPAKAARGYSKDVHSNARNDAPPSYPRSEDEPSGISGRVTVRSWLAAASGIPRLFRRATTRRLSTRQRTAARRRALRRTELT